MNVVDDHAYLRLVRMLRVKGDQKQLFEIVRDSSESGQRELTKLRSHNIQ